MITQDRPTISRQTYPMVPRDSNRIAFATTTQLAWISYHQILFNHMNQPTINNLFPLIHPLDSPLSLT